MKAAIIVVLLLVVAGVLAALLLNDPGYAAVRWGRHLVEMSLPTFVLTLIVAYFLVRLLVHAFGLRRWADAAYLSKRREQARGGFFQGMIELCEGDWAAAEETLSAAAKYSDAAHVHYLGAARAAELLGSTE